MSQIPDTLRYSKEHEWVKMEDGIATIGITDFAQEQLGEVVYVELPEVGRTLDFDETFGVVESVKTVSDLFAPLAGEVVAVNENLLEDSDNFAPDKVNGDPYGDGWMVKIRVQDTGDGERLLDAESYAAHIG